MESERKKGISIPLSLFFKVTESPKHYKTKHGTIIAFHAEENPGLFTRLPTF
jgi:hypothetical protein